MGHKAAYLVACWVDSRPGLHLRAASFTLADEGLVVLLETPLWIRGGYGVGCINIGIIYHARDVHCCIVQEMIRMVFYPTC